jgi:hypothetical protein
VVVEVRGIVVHAVPIHVTDTGITDEECASLPIWWMSLIPCCLSLGRAMVTQPGRAPFEDDLAISVHRLTFLRLEHQGLTSTLYLATISSLPIIVLAKNKSLKDGGRNGRRQGFEQEKPCRCNTALMVVDKNLSSEIMTRWIPLLHSRRCKTSPLR